MREIRRTDLGCLGPSIYRNKRDMMGEVVALVDVTFEKRGLELIVTDEETEIGGRVAWEPAFNL